LHSIVKLDMRSNVHWAACTACHRDATRRTDVSSQFAELWRPASSRTPPPLTPEAVHVWRIPLESPHPLDDAWSVLSEEEQARARRFVQERHRRRFVAAHAALRRILAGYTGLPAPQLRFSTGPHGKPALETSSGSRPRLEFNLSHSADIALVAVARERPVGVDLEQWERDMDHLELAERFFSPAERESLRALAERHDDLVSGFFAAWSRKEAYLTALGHGVTRGLHHFDVTLAPSEPARLLADRIDGAIDRWRMCSLVPETGFSGALVVADPLGEVLLLDER
jgi:4'-phosphopantetheinyl transferase